MGTSSSRRRSVLTIAELASRVRRVHGGVWVLALRLEPGARVRRVERELAAFGEPLRSSDLVAHDEGSETFAIAMPAPVSSHDGVASAIALGLSDPVRSAWLYVSPREDLFAEMERRLGRCRLENERGDLAVIAHELATPASAIYGCLCAVLDGTVDEATAQHFLEAARDESARLGRMIRRLSGQQFAARRPRTNVVTAFEQAIAVVAPLAMQRNARIELCERSAGAVPLETDTTVQILVNLLENAVKHGREGGMVQARTLTSDSTCQFEVDDDGPGVDEDDRERIFHLGERRNDRVPGAGIGLAVAHSLVDDAGGELRVQRSPLGGARFILRLPNVDQRRRAHVARLPVPP